MAGAILGTLAKSPGLWVSRPTGLMGTNPLSGALFSSTYGMAKVPASQRSKNDFESLAVRSEIRRAGRSSTVGVPDMDGATITGLLSFSLAISACPGHETFVR